MSLPIQLISTDFDGTIFAEFENPPIPQSLQRLIADLQSKGVKWVINTGRDMSSLMEALARAQISVEPDYLVLVEREIHFHDGVRYARLEPWNTACDRAHAEIFRRVRPDVPRLTEWINERFHATVYEDPFSPFCLIAANPDDAEKIHTHLEDYCRAVPGLTVVRNDVYARFSHTDYNKGTALAEISRRLGVPPARVFAAGDHWNDLPMLLRDNARWLASPHNAIEPVKLAVRNQNGYVSRESHGAGIYDALMNCLGNSIK